MSLKNSNLNIWITEYLSREEIYQTLVSEIIYQGKSDYQDISIIKLLNGSKALYLDNQIQSTTEDEFIYHESIVHVPFITHQNPESILIVGAGEGATAREALKWNLVKEITLIEIDKDVIFYCDKYLPEMNLGSYYHPKVKLEICDARVYIKNIQKKYDIILCDLCDQRVDNSPIINHEFLNDCKKILKNNGYICIQSGEMPYRKSVLFHNYIEMLKSIFCSVSIFTVWIPSYCRSWAFVLVSEKKSNYLPYDSIKEIVQKNINSK